MSGTQGQKPASPKTTDYFDMSFGKYLHQNTNKHCCEYSDTISDSTTENGDLENGRDEQWDDPCSPLGSPATTVDGEDSTSKRRQAELPAPLARDSNAIRSLLSSYEAGLESDSQHFFNNINAVHQLFVLLVLLYNVGNDQSETVQASVTSVTNTIVVIFKFHQASAVKPPSWVLILLDNQKVWQPGRWIGEFSRDWIDTTWRTAHSVLHVGAVSALATLPWLNLARLQALWAASRRRSLPTSRGAQTPVLPSELNTALPVRTHPAGKRPARGAKANPDQSSSNNQQKQDKGKEPARRPNGNDEENYDSAAEENPPKRPTRTKQEKKNKMPFACHFFKRWPLKHLECLFHPQQTCRHLKTHYARRHLLPPFCPTCWDIFGTRAACNAHIRLRACFQTMPYPHGDGVTEDQQNDLDHLPPGDGEEKWYNMWRVLFPGVPEPTSPYIDIEHYEDYAVDAVYQARGPVFTGGLIELQSNQTLNGDQGEQVMNRFSQAFETSWTNPNVNPVNPVDAPQMIQQQQQQQQQQHYSHAESSSQAAARAPAQNLGPGIQPQCQNHAGGSHSQGLFPSAQLFMPTWTQPEDLRQPNQQPASYTADVNSQWNQDVSSHPHPGHHHRQNGNGAHHSSQSQHPQWRPANNMRRTQPIRSTPHVNHRFNPYGVPHPAQPSCPSSPPPEGFDAAFFNSEFFQRLMSELMAQSQHDTHPDQTSADCFSGIHHQPIPPAAAATHDMLQQHGVHQPQTMVSDQVLHDIDPDLLGHNFSVPAQNTQPAENAGINSAPQASSSQVGPDPATADEQEEDADASPDDPTDLSDVGSDYFNVRGAP